MHQLPFFDSVSITTRVLEIVHSDIWTTRVLEIVHSDIWAKIESLQQLLETRIFLTSASWGAKIPSTIPTFQLLVSASIKQSTVNLGRMLNRQLVVLPYFYRLAIFNLPTRPPLYDFLTLENTLPRIWTWSQVLCFHKRAMREEPSLKNFVI